MSFEQATEKMRAAIAAGDLDALKLALEARAEALASGARPTPSAIEAGERALLDLWALKRGLAVESARVAQLRGSSMEARPRPHVDCKG